MADEQRGAQAMNSIESDLSFTTETAKDFNDTWLPTLDFQMKIVDTTDKDILIKYKFYKKPMASKFTVINDSALSNQVISSTIVAELNRRLVNTSTELIQTEKNESIDEYSGTLRRFGFKQEEIRSYVKAALIGYERKLVRCKEGKETLQRKGTDIK